MSQDDLPDSNPTPAEPAAVAAEPTATVAGAAAPAEPAASIEPPSAPSAPELAACSLCGKSVLQSSLASVNGRAACASCVGRVRAELAAQAPTPGVFPLATAGGLVGALIGAAVWTGIVIATDYQVGFVAVLVGYLAGTGVKLGAGKHRGKPLQVLAAALSFFGLLVAKYATFAYAVVDNASKRGYHVSYFDPRILTGATDLPGFSVFPSFFDALPKLVTAFDAIFVFIAIAAAFRVPKATPVTIIER